jgi:hypothetical protein
LDSEVVDQIRGTPKTSEQPHQVCLHFGVFMSCFRQNINTFHDHLSSQPTTTEAFLAVRATVTKRISKDGVVSRPPHPQLRSYSHSSFNSYLESGTETQRTVFAASMAISRPECRLRWRLTPIFWRIRRRCVEGSSSKPSNFESTHQIAISFNQSDPYHKVKKPCQ